MVYAHQCRRKVLVHRWRPRVGYIVSGNPWKRREFSCRNQTFVEALPCGETAKSVTVEPGDVTVDTRSKAVDTRNMTVDATESFVDVTGRVDGPGSHVIPVPGAGRLDESPGLHVQVVADGLVGGDELPAVGHRLRR